MIFGPWTDEASELAGWDVERFQQIADAPGDPYLDHDVEYPPLTVGVAEIVLADDVVTSHRRLVALSLAIDLSVAAVLARRWRPGAGLAYLLLGLPLVPSGLLRLDLWAALAAVIAAAAIAPGRTRDEGRPQRGAGPIFAAATVVGAMIKIWPALLVAAALGIRQVRTAAVAAAVGLAAGILWLSISGTGALDQITSLRGVTGWHVESIPGTLISLVGSDEARLEADAFRTGTLNDTMVLVGRLVAVAATATAAVLAARSNSRASDRLALVMLGSTTALIVTAPLLSPQFMLWLTPWAAILHRDRLLLGLTGTAVALTALILAVFGPPDLDHRVAAAGLLARNGVLVAVVALSLQRLNSSDSLGSRRSGDG